MATALWVKTIRKHHIDLQTTVPCGRDDPREALREACHELDLPEPLTPVSTVSSRMGIRQVMFFRLLVLTPKRLIDFCI